MRRRVYEKMEPEEQLRAERAVGRLAVECPGLTADEIAVSVGETERTVHAVLKARHLNSFRARVAASPYFRDAAGRETGKQSLYPAAPYRVGHCDTSRLGIRCADGTAVAARVAVIVDGLTNLMIARILREGETFADFVTEQLDHHPFEVLVLDGRAESHPIIPRITRRGVHHVRTSLGTIWMNTRVERLHHRVRVALAKFPASDYVSPRTVDKRLAKFVANHNHAVHRNGLPSPAEMQRKRAQWTRDEVKALAIARGRDVCDIVEYRAFAETPEPFAYVITDRKGRTEAETYAHFASRVPDGFYWAML